MACYLEGQPSSRLKLSEIEHQGGCDILYCGHSGREVNRLPSSTSIRWASEIGATSVKILNLVHVSFNVDTIFGIVSVSKSDLRY